jgi:hypothetical protein
MYPVCAWRPGHVVVPARGRALRAAWRTWPGRRLVASGHSPAAARHVMTADGQLAAVDDNRSLVSRTVTSTCARAAAMRGRANLGVYPVRRAEQGYL